MTEYLVPNEAWKKIKASNQLNEPVYIYAAATYGKTELVKQYLSKKKYLYISCLNDLSKLNTIFNQDALPKIIVIDDLSMLRDEEGKEKVIRLIKQKDINIFLLSRCSVPEWLFPVYLESGFLIIKESNFFIDDETIKNYFLRNQVNITDDDLKYICNFSGWNAYIINCFLRLFQSGETDVKLIGHKVVDMLLEYIDTNIINQWDTDLIEFLMPLSIVKEFDISLAEFITGNSQVNSLIKRTSEIGNFLYLNNGKYTIKKIVKEAILRRAKRIYDNSLMNSYLYNIGLYYETHEDIIKALDVYTACQAKERIKELLIRNARNNPSVGHFYDLKNYYLNMDKEDIGNSFILMAAVSLLYSLLLKKDESEYWYNRLKEYVTKTKDAEYREASARLIYLDFCLSHRSNNNLINILTKAYQTIISGVNIPEVFLTNSTPSIINGVRDLCFFTKDKEFITKYGRITDKVFENIGDGLLELTLAEILYEKNTDVYEILTLLSRSQIKFGLDESLELSFVDICIKARLNLIHGNEEDSMNIIKTFENKVVKSNNYYLLPNIKALKCRIALYEINIDYIDEWMNIAPNEDKEFYILDCYGYITKIKCYISRKEYLKAYSLLEKVRFYAKECDRVYTLMEIELLTSIVKYRMNDNNYLNHMKKCLIICNEYQFQSFIFEEGIAILDILELVKKDTEFMKEINNEWFNSILINTRKMAQIYPVYLKNSTPDLSDFSKNGLEVLRYQANGYSISEISEKLNINIDTVKYHTKQNYKKLGVAGKTEAVLAARNLGIL